MNKNGNITGTVLKITDDQLRTILTESFTEMVNEVPAGLVGRFIDMVLVKAKRRNEENCLWWSHVIKELEGSKEKE